MRVKQPEQFDPEKEYKPGERAVYNDMVIIAEVWTKAAQIVPEPCFVNGASVVGLDGTFAPGRICIAISTTEPTERRYFGG